jgi:hypothetical protein
MPEDYVDEGEFSEFIEAKVSDNARKNGQFGNVMREEEVMNDEHAKMVAKMKTIGEFLRKQHQINK